MRAASPLLCIVFLTSCDSDRSSLRELAAFVQAARDGSLARAKELLAANRDLINARDPTTGHCALHAARTREVAEYLLDRGARLSVETPEKNTPLHLAAANIHRTEVAELLVARGADVHAKAVNGATPLHCAAQFSHLAIVKLLLEKGADVDAKTLARPAPPFVMPGGYTPLHLAANSGRPTGKAVVQLLLAHGADVHAKSDAGQTPLHLAAQRGATEVVELLLPQGADINAEDNSGCTPWDSAYAGTRVTAEVREKVLSLLERHGGKTGSCKGTTDFYRKSHHGAYERRRQKAK